MLQREVVRFRAAENQPNPLEVDYWIDITANRYGGIIKYYRNDTLTWEVMEPNPELLKQMIAELKKWVESEISRLENDLWLNINNINSRIDDLQIEVQAKIDQLEMYVRNQISNLETYVDDSITAIRSDFNTFKQEVNSQIGQLVTYIDNSISGVRTYIDQQISSVNSRITNLTNTVSNLDTRIDNIDDSIISINNKITNIENNLGNVGELLDEEYITQLINKLISENKISVLDPVQQAMNKGTGVVLALPSANNGKISLPIWTGTEAEYNQLTKVAGMTYNIIDEESE